MNSTTENLTTSSTSGNVSQIIFKVNNHLDPDFATFLLLMQKKMQ